MFLSLPILSLPLLQYYSPAQILTTSAVLLCFSVWSSSTCLPGYVCFVLFYIALPCPLCTFRTSYHTAFTYIYLMQTIAVILFDCRFVISFHGWDTLTWVNSELKLKDWILCTFSKNPSWTVYKLNVCHIWYIMYARSHSDISQKIWAFRLTVMRTSHFAVDTATTNTLFSYLFSSHCEIISF